MLAGARPGRGRQCSCRLSGSDGRERSEMRFSRAGATLFLFIHVFAVCRVELEP